jgi:hypothetical protein
VTALASRPFQRAEIVALAVVIPDGRVAQRGFGGDAAAIEPVLRAARQLLRETTPAIDVVDFRFALGRAVVGSVGDRVVLVRTASNDDARAVLSNAAMDANALSAELESAEAPASVTAKVLAVDPGAPAVPEAVAAAPAQARREHVATALNLVLVEAKKHLGGPVIRNYLKKSRGDANELANVAIGLDGQVTDPAPEQPATEELGARAGGWLDAFLVTASVVAPDLRELDVVALTKELEPLLRPLQFYAAHTTRTR